MFNVSPMRLLAAITCGERSNCFPRALLTSACCLLKRSTGSILAGNPNCDIFHIACASLTPSRLLRSSSKTSIAFLLCALDIPL